MTSVDFFDSTKFKIILSATSMIVGFILSKGYDAIKLKHEKRKALKKFNSLKHTYFVRRTNDDETQNIGVFELSSLSEAGRMLNIYGIYYQREVKGTLVLDNSIKTGEGYFQNEPPSGSSSKWDVKITDIKDDVIELRINNNKDGHSKLTWNKVGEEFKNRSVADLDDNYCLKFSPNVRFIKF